MRYFYADDAGQPAGPVELAALYAALHAHTLSPDTPVTENGGTEWKPLAQVLRYHYSVGQEIFGPVMLAELPALAASRGHDLPVIPEGGHEWMPVFTVLRLPPRQFVMVPVTIPRDSPEGAHHVEGLYMPDAAKAAGILWFLFGLLKVVDCFVVIGNLSSVPIGARDVVLVVLGIGVIVAMVFLRAGLKTCAGSARGTLGNGVGSLVLGLLACFAGGRSWRTDDLTARVVMIASAATLVIAGILAILANRRYVAWRKSPRNR